LTGPPRAFRGSCNSEIISTTEGYEDFNHENTVLDATEPHLVLLGFGEKIALYGVGIMAGLILTVFIAVPLLQGRRE
jgi:hypothetical protein